MGVKNIFGGRKSLKKLEFGCGEAGPRSGFEGVDIRPLPGISYVCKAWEIVDFVGEESVDAVASRHFFEHLTFAQAEKTCEAWNRILVVGGTIEVMVPDLRFHVAQFLNGDRANATMTGSKGWSDIKHALAGFYGWQRDGLTESWDVHKSGYDYPLLVGLLESYGFSSIKRKKSKPWNLHVVAKKTSKVDPAVEYFKAL